MSVQTIAIMAELPQNYEELSSDELMNKLVENAQIRNEAFRRMPGNKAHPQDISTDPNPKKIAAMINHGYARASTDYLLSKIPEEDRGNLPHHYAGSGEYVALEFNVAGE